MDHRLQYNRVPLIASKSPKYSTWARSQKQQNDLCSFQRQLIQNHSNRSLCPYHQGQRSCVEQFYDDLQDLLELTLKKRCPFHHRGLEYKSRKSRDLETGKFGLGVQNEAGKRLTVLPREHAGHILFQQHKRRLYTWTITRWSIPKSD